MLNDPTPQRRCTKREKPSILSANGFIVGISKGAAKAVILLLQNLLHLKNIPDSLKQRF
jgi:hypothetical protein